MRRIVTALATTVTVLVLLFSYHTSTNSAGLAGTAAVGPAAPGSSSATASGGSAARAPSTSPTTAGARTITGDVAQTRWGAVQVEITVAGGRITAARTVQVPSGNDRDDEINQVAVPILDAAVLDVQSARIDTVSGATVTSDGYKQSLQSAIDQAGL